MNTSSKHSKRSLLFTGTVALTAITLAASASVTVHKHGTDILHYFVHKVMLNTGLESAASAQVDSRQNQQGNANNQNLDILVKGLDTSATYLVFAFRDGDTNFTKVTEFSADKKGRAALHYRHLGNGKAIGRGKLPLPDLMNPVSLVRALEICNVHTQAVLTADLTMPDRLQYLIKRDMSTNEVVALLRINANQKVTQFRLQVTGLSPSSSYLLVLNNSEPQSFPTDTKGRLLIKSPMEVPTDILDLRSVALWDSVSNVITSTTLP